MVCKNCGYENNDTSAFCAECGAPLAREERNAPELPNEIPAEAASQPVCAAPEADPAATQPFTPVPAPEAPVYAAPARQQPYAYPQPAAPKAPQPEKKKGKGGRIALIVTVVVLALALVAAGVLCYLLYADKQEREQEEGSLRTQLAEIDRKYETLNDDYYTLTDDYNALSSKYDTLTGDYDELSGQYDELSAAYEEMSDYANGLYEEYSGLYDEAIFYRQHAVVCSEMNKYYHTYECEDWDRDGFWIYNVEAAKGKDFTPCPKCMAESDADAN